MTRTGNRVYSCMCTYIITNLLSKIGFYLPLYIYFLYFFFHPNPTTRFPILYFYFFFFLSFIFNLSSLCFEVYVVNFVLLPPLLPNNSQNSIFFFFQILFSYNFIIKIFFAFSDFVQPNKKSDQIVRVTNLDN
ncbi:hypothetical protein CD36_06710 [Candida dubliniensis CD36]|uniref:Uncharacterized protein n=1 Tax=Candida dubliniensis (strain CD36 / ATCC MYA-646 / CBS 7987 / NCPF 3949 / NRRL Y-17841) TaxID=573826 RepID=B9W8A9_CANDC|nr:hypothetical protein CD36_06710 [Candida dubliniensis CD36]CAX44966.1 hypothetical protein CD36_06710 [Candida dubliniensis CD36]